MTSPQFKDNWPKEPQWKVLASELEQFQDSEQRKIAVNRADKQATLGLLELYRLGEHERIKKICKGSLAQVLNYEEGI